MAVNVATTAGQFAADATLTAHFGGTGDAGRSAPSQLAEHRHRNNR